MEVLGLILQLTSFTPAATTTPVVLGDANGDGTVNFLDITPFIALLSASVVSPEADINGDGMVNFLDITPFIALLTTS